MFCPHCGGELPGHDDTRGGRCATCRLVVGAGRARDVARAEVRTGGFMANAARRESAEPVAPQEAFAALRGVAADVGCAVDRLRMTDYDTAIRDGVQGPSVAAILTTFDTWKAARSAAVDGSDRDVFEGAGTAEAAGAG